MKFINRKTKEIRTFELVEVDDLKDLKKNQLVWCPYLERITEGICKGHQHAPAYWDKEGNEWRQSFNYRVNGSVLPDSFFKYKSSIPWPKVKATKGKILYEHGQ